MKKQYNTYTQWNYHATQKESILNENDLNVNVKNFNQGEMLLQSQTCESKIKPKMRVTKNEALHSYEQTI